MRTSITHRPAVLRRCALASAILLGCAAGAPAAQAFDLDLGAIKWSGMARYFVIDYPETATLQIKPFPLPGLAQPAARIVLSQYRGLFYLNAYQDLKYQQRVYKSPPMALFSPEELRACAAPEYPVPVADNWPSSIPACWPIQASAQPSARSS